MDPEAFVENLEGMASAALSNVTDEVFGDARNLRIFLHLSFRTYMSLQIFWKCNQDGSLVK